MADFLNHQITVGDVLAASAAGIFASLVLLAIAMWLVNRGTIQ